MASDKVPLAPNQSISLILPWQYVLQLTLFGYWRSSSAWRLRIAMNLKGIDYEQVSVNLLKGEQTEQDWLEVNSMGQVPMLQLADGRRLTQSMAILQYLEAEYPAVPIYPSDPWRRAKANALAEIPNSFIQPLQNLSTLKAVEAYGVKRADWAKQWIEKGLASMEWELQATAGLYCVGDDVTVADICLVPQMYGARRFGVDVSNYPTILAIEARLMELPAFQAADCDVQPDSVKPQ